MLSVEMACQILVFSGDSNKLYDALLMLDSCSETQLPVSPAIRKVTTILKTVLFFTFSIVLYKLYEKVIILL